MYSLEEIKKATDIYVYLIDKGELKLDDDKELFNSYGEQNIKVILDGMVEAGVIKNDGWKEVLGFRDSFYVDKDNPRIEVFIHGTDPDK